MIDFETATTLFDSSNGYTVNLSTDWAGVGTPNGGYLAVIALRAAGRSSPDKRPASFSCQFLASPQFGPIDVKVTPAKEGKRAAAYRVELVQNDRLCLQAIVWAVAQEGEGFNYETDAAPEIPSPDTLLPFNEAIPDDDSPDAPVFLQIDNRPVEDWQSQTSTAPKIPRDLSWNRFQPDPIFTDRFLDAGRILVASDIVAFWPMSRLHGPGFTKLKYFAPNIDLTFQFHTDTRDHQWLLTDATAESASNGTVASILRVWGEDQQLLATGTSTMFCLPNPAYKGEELS